MAEKKNKTEEIVEKDSTKKKTAAKKTADKADKGDQTAIFEKALQDLLKLAGEKNNLFSLFQNQFISSKSTIDKKSL